MCIKLLLFSIMAFLIYIFYKKQGYSNELENFVEKRKNDNICSRPFIVRGNNSFYSKLLNLDKKVDNLEFVIMKKRKKDMSKKLDMLDKKYAWMNNYHQSIVDPNSEARKLRSKKAKNKIRNDFKNSQKSAEKEFKLKYENMFLDALRSGKSLPALVPNISSKLQNTLNKYKNPKFGNRAKSRAKNKARKKIREGEEGLWEPAKSIVKLINDMKEDRMNKDFKSNDNAPGVKGNLSFGQPNEGREISNSKFSGAYA